MSMALVRQPLRLQGAPTRQPLSCGQYQAWIRQLAENPGLVSPTATRQVYAHLHSDRCAACAQVAVQNLAPKN